MPEEKQESKAETEEPIELTPEPPESEPVAEAPKSADEELAKVFHGDIQFGSEPAPTETEQEPDLEESKKTSTAALESISFSAPPEPPSESPPAESSSSKTAALESISFSAPSEPVPEPVAPTDASPVQSVAEPQNTPSPAPAPPPPAAPPTTLEVGPMSPEQAVAHEAAAQEAAKSAPEPVSESVRAITPVGISADDIVSSLQSEIVADLEMQVPDLTARLAGRTFENVSEKFADRIGRGNKQTIKWLSLFLLMAIGFTTIPALQYYELSEAPGWANAIWIISALQFVYVCWIVLLPDWSTVWVGMVLFALSAGLYALCFGIVLFSPVDKEIILQLDMIRSKAPGWCVCIVLLMGMMSFLCSRLANKWRRAYELAKAGRINP